MQKNVWYSEMKTRVLELFANKKIPCNPESHAFFQYCNSSIDWFQEHVIIIAFIDKMVTVNYEYYKTIITQLHAILKSSLTQLLQIPDVREHQDFKYTEHYIQWLLTTTTNDLLTYGLTPRFDNNEFMYILFYDNFYTLGLWSIHNTKSYSLDYVIENSIFNEEIFNLLYSNVRTTHNKKHRTYDEMNNSNNDDAEDDSRSNKRMRQT